MTGQEIGELLEKQRAFYKSGATVPVAFRREQLKKLYAAVKKYQKEIEDALKADLGKSPYEGFMCESGLVLTEISYMLRHVRKFAKRKRVHTPLAQFLSHSFRQPVPYGNVLIMSPWNYPFLLTLDPLTDAIAAGNTVILKPSAYSPATGRIPNMWRWSGEEERRIRHFWTRSSILYFSPAVRLWAERCFVTPQSISRPPFWSLAEKAPVLWIQALLSGLRPEGSFSANFSTAARPAWLPTMSSASVRSRTNL